MRKLLGPIGVAWTLLLCACRAVPQAPNVEQLMLRYAPWRSPPPAPPPTPVRYHYDAFRSHNPSRTFLSSVPQSRSDMAANASPFQLHKNPFYLRSLVAAATAKLAAGRRYDLPQGVLTPPGGAFPGLPQARSPFGVPQAPLGGGFGAPQYLPQAPQQLLPPSGLAFSAPQQQQFGLPPAPAQGNPLTPEEFQQYLKEATAPQHEPQRQPQPSGGDFLSKDEFQKYLKIATKKNKVNGPVLSPDEFQKYVLAAQAARDAELTKSGKPRPGKLQTLTPEDFKKFFAANNKEKLAGAGSAPLKKHKRGGYHSSSSSSHSSGFTSGAHSFEEYPSGPSYGPPPPKYGPPPSVEFSPDNYHHIESEDAATKRSVLDALWRAFQAITGGALTIGGQLARGSGAILQAKGKLIASAGPVVSEFGKTIATKAVGTHYTPNYSHGTPYHYSDEHHPSHPSLLQTAYEVASSFKVAALSTSKAVADLISELSSASAKAYLLKE